MLEKIKHRLENNYDRQRHFIMRDIRFLVKMLEKEIAHSEKYWEAANTAELRIQELEEQLEQGGRNG